jgi:hypothetical protein
VKQLIIVRIEKTEGDYMSPTELVSAVKAVEAQLEDVAPAEPRTVKAHGNKGDIYKVEGWVSRSIELL